MPRIPRFYCKCCRKRVWPRWDTERQIYVCRFCKGKVQQ